MTVLLCVAVKVGYQLDKLKTVSLCCACSLNLLVTLDLDKINHSVMGIIELGKHVSIITQGIASLGEVLRRVYKLTKETQVVLVHNIVENTTSVERDLVSLPLVFTVVDEQERVLLMVEQLGDDCGVALP